VRRTARSLSPRQITLGELHVEYILFHTIFLFIVLGRRFGLGIFFSWNVFLGQNPDLGTGNSASIEFPSHGFRPILLQRLLEFKRFPRRVCLYLHRDALTTLNPLMKQIATHFPVPHLADAQPSNGSNLPERPTSIKRNRENGPIGQNLPCRTGIDCKIRGNRRLISKMQIP
jgi:hypothetical protein